MASAVGQPARGSAGAADRRAADTRETAEERTGTAEERTGTAEERTGTAEERTGTADESTVTSARPGIAARGANAAGSFMLMTSRAVRIVAWLVVIVIVAGILLRLLDANTTNAIVRDVHNVAKALIGPFGNVFTLHHDQRTELAVNWGLAAAVYLILGMIVAALIGQAASRAKR